MKAVGKDGIVTHEHARARSTHGVLVVTLLAAITVMRFVVALGYAPVVTDDQSGYEASAYRLATVGSFAYPASWSGMWSATSSGNVITNESRDAFLRLPRNAYTMPGYPAFRALIFRLTSNDELWRTWTRLLQAMISVIGAYLLYLLARRYSERAGLFALLMALAYQPLTTANSHLLTDVLFTYLLLSCAYCVVLWSEHRKIGYAVATGLTLGLTFWVRPTVALWAIIAAALAVIFYRAEWRRIATHLFAAGAVTLVVVAPWWVRNYALYHRFVPVSTSGSVTTIGAIRIDAAHQWPFPWQSEGPPSTPAQREIERLASLAMEPTPSAVREGDMAVSDLMDTRQDALTREIARRFPGEMLRLRARSLLIAFAQPYAYVRWYNWYSALTGLLHYLLLAACITTPFVLRRRFDTLLIASVPVYFVALHAIMIPFNRYLFPAMPFAIILAAALLDRLVRIPRQVPTIATLPQQRSDSDSDTQR